MKLKNYERGKSGQTGIESMLLFHLYLSGPLLFSLLFASKLNTQALLSGGFPTPSVLLRGRVELQREKKPTSNYECFYVG